MFDGVNSSPTKNKTTALKAPGVILFVDDEADILSSFKFLLEASNPGIRVITAASGKEGLDILDHEEVDMILSDFKMPGMDGMEFLVRARRNHPSVPRAMFTAFADDALANRARSEAGVSEFISKAESPPEIFRRIQAMLDGLPRVSAVPE